MQRPDATRSRSRLRRHTLTALICIAAASLSACTFPTPAPKVSRFLFFSEPERDDSWFDKIEDWQRRELSDAPESALASPGLPNGKPPARIRLADRETTTLRRKYVVESAEERRHTAQRFMTWSQLMAREHYRKDTDETADPWPTTAELLEQGGDDCDGLDLLAYSLLRDFGFERNELFRAIVRRDRDRANHMVTLWFEDREDPWVIDATGAISLGLKRMSELDGWTPTRVFNEYHQFTVVDRLPPESP